MNMDIAGLLLLATLVEGFTEYLFGKIENKAVKFLMPYIALVFGVCMAFAYKVDILGMFNLHSNPHVAYFVSGLLLGRGSNYLNDLVSAIQGFSSPKVLQNPILNQPNVTLEKPQE